MYMVKYRKSTNLKNLRNCMKPLLWIFLNFKKNKGIICDFFFLLRIFKEYLVHRLFRIADFRISNIPFFLRSISDFYGLQDHELHDYKIAQLCQLVLSDNQTTVSFITSIIRLLIFLKRSIDFSYCTQAKIAWFQNIIT